MAFDNSRKHFIEVIRARVVSGSSKLFDAIGKTSIGENDGYAFHRAVEASAAHPVPNSHCIGLTADEFGERFHVVFIESPDKIGDVFIGRSSKCPIEKPKSLETVLHLVHPVKAICSYWVAVVRALQAAEISRGGEVLIADGRLARCRTVWLQRCWNRRQERLTHFESALTSSTSPPASAQPLKPTSRCATLV